MTPQALHEALGHATSDKRLEVLRLVGQSGSISQAARDAGISYKAAWQAIETLTSLCGASLVERTVGGTGGGGARITPQGLQLLEMSAALASARAGVLARFAGGASLAGGLGLRTSMRNQLPCQVARFLPTEGHDPVVLVALCTPGGQELQASLTRESADLLGLVEGSAVLAMCKATAVRVGPRKRLEALAASDACVLQGQVARVSSGGTRDELTLALPGGGQWVGFAEPEWVATKGDAACAAMAMSALVIGVNGAI
jgi:molybdate transport system regulatory protein